jgi:hypothetical protein
MSSDNLELASAQLQNLKTTLKQLKNLVASNGTGNNNSNASRIQKLKTQYTDIHDKLTKLIPSSSSSLPREWDALKKETKQVHDDFLRADKVVQSHHLDENNNNAAFAGNSTAQQQQQLLQQARRYDTSALDTREELERQRLNGIREIEQSANEVKGMFADFNILLTTQQGGLDIVSKNLDKATEHVTKGADEIRKARKM